MSETNREESWLKRACARVRKKLEVIGVLDSLPVLLIAVVIVSTGFPSPSPDGAVFAPSEIAIRYSRLSKEEVVGTAILKEHKEVAALALQGLPITPEQFSIEPIYKDVVDQMSAENLTENLALLSLIKRYEPSSERFLASKFFEQLQERNSRYGFARAFVVRFSSQQDVQAIVNAINRSRNFLKTKNLVVQASLVRISPVVGMRVDNLSGTLPSALAPCGTAGTTVAVIGDQFHARADLPKLQPIAASNTTAQGCDNTPYAIQSESHGTNLAGVINSICPTCRVLGLDAGCSSGGKGVIRATEGAVATLSAVLRGASVLLFTTADTKMVPLYEEALDAAVNAGAVIVAPAGDDAAEGYRYPAISRGVIGVIANNPDGSKAEFSNYGSMFVTSARGALTATTHGEGGVATVSSSSVAAARVAGFAARYLIRNPDAQIPAVAVLAAGGGLSDRVPDECQGGAGGGGTSDGTSSGSGSSTGGSAGGNGDSSNSGGSSGGGTGGSSSGGGSGSSGGTTTNPPVTAVPTATSGTSGSGNNSSDGNTSARNLATLELPASITTTQAGVSPFMVQKFQTAKIAPAVKVGVASKGTTIATTEVFVANKPGSVAQVVYKNNTPAERALAQYTRIGEPSLIDKNEKGPSEFVQTIALPPGVDIRATLGAQSGIVGIYISDELQEDTTASSGSGTSISSAASTKKETPTDSLKISSASTPGDNATALKEMDWSDDVRNFTKRFTEKAKVAIISTGLDYERPEFQTSLTKDLRVTDSSGWPALTDFPRDLDGFGTQVASLLGHEQLGIAKDFIELIPIRAGKTKADINKRFGNSIARAIALAVNKGADLIVLPHSATSAMKPLWADNYQGICDPVIGHAIYKAREKGAMFILPAGDGFQFPGAAEPVGFPVVAARDDGPGFFGITETPACWGRYFLGAVSFAASQGFGKPLPRFANYGDDIEMSAPGVDISTASLRNTLGITKGSVSSAAWGAAAAAMAIAHHKTLAQRFGAWYIENLLVASAQRDPNADTYEQRVRFGSHLNFRQLMNLLIRTESMTEYQRRNDIETINPRQGDGWKPGEDKAELRYVSLALGKSLLQPGEEVSYKVIAFFRNGEERDVTTDIKNTFVSTSKIGGKTYIEIVRPGLLRVRGAEDFADFKKQLVKKVSFAVSVNFAYQQAQGFDSELIAVDLTDTPLTLRTLSITPPGNQLRIGKAIYPFTAQAEYSNDAIANVTGGATWSTSDPSELKVTSSPGILDARSAVSGKSYTVTASYQGKTTQIAVTVAEEQMKSFYIHNYLGSIAKIERGQRATLEARMVLSSGSFDREQAMDAVWYSGTRVLNGGARSTALVVDTKDLAPGTYTYRAVSVFKSRSGNREVSETITLVVVDEIARLEIHLKTPIVQIGQPFFIDVRAYRHNNSYVVVTKEATWTTSVPQFVSINQSGVGFVSDDFVNSTFTIAAEFKGQKAEITVNAIRGSVVTGSDANIDYLTLEVNIRNTFTAYCYPPSATVTAVYKDGQKRSLRVASQSFAELGADGKWKEATFPLYGGRTYRLSATYNDGNSSAGGGGNAVASATFVMPKRPLEKLCLGGWGPDGTLYCPDYSDPRASVPTLTLDPSTQEAKDEVSVQGSCKIISAPVTPTPGLATELTNSFAVKLKASKPGPYSVKVTGYYTGMGIRELKEGSFPVKVGEQIPARLAVSDVNRELWYSGSGIPKPGPSVGRYGTQAFEVNLLSNLEKPLVFKPEDIEIILRQGDRVIDGKNDPRVRMEVSDNRRRIHVHTYPRTFGESYTLSVRHLSTGIAAPPITFNTPGSWESSDTTPWNLPSETSPTPNAKLHPACESYLKAPTGLEYAGGAGTNNDPLIICDTAQLEALGKSVCKTNYCNRTGAKCVCDSKQPWAPAIVVALGADIDFQMKKIAPIRKDAWAGPVNVKGDMHEIQNYAIVDSERNDMALLDLPGVQIRDLIIRNPAVRGNEKVAALALTASSLENVTLIGGSVWGASSVGGLVVEGYNLKNVRVFGTQVRIENLANGVTQGCGGIATIVREGDQLLFSGQVGAAGVPGNVRNLAGIATLTRGRVSNVLMTGNVIALHGRDGGSSAAGIAVVNGGMLINTVMRGNVVATGSFVGGISVLNDWTSSAEQGGFTSSFGVDPLKPNPPHPFTWRSGAIIRARVEGSIWAGMSMQWFKCNGEVSKIIGVGGGSECLGDIVAKSGGSIAGGIVASNGGLIQDSEFLGTIRGASGVGGLAGINRTPRGTLGHAFGEPYVANYVRNKVSGVISASEGASENGALIGIVPALLANMVPPRFDGNVIVPQQGNPSWAFGQWLNRRQVSITPEITEFFDP